MEGKRISFLVATILIIGILILASGCSNVRTQRDLEVATVSNWQTAYFYATNEELSFAIQRVFVKNGFSMEAWYEVPCDPKQNGGCRVMICDKKINNKEKVNVKIFINGITFGPENANVAIMGDSGEKEGTKRKVARVFVRAITTPSLDDINAIKKHVRNAFLENPIDDYKKAQKQNSEGIELDGAFYDSFFKETLKEITFVRNVYGE